LLGPSSNRSVTGKSPLYFAEKLQKFVGHGNMSGNFYIYQIQNVEGKVNLINGKMPPRITSFN